MYLNIRVPVPEVKGRIFFSNRKNGTIVNYEYGRVYVPEKRYNIPKRTTIGKICPDDPKMMNPNANYMKYFPDEKLPEFLEGSVRSSCLKIGSWIVIRKIIEDYGLDVQIESILGRNAGLFFDLAAYTIIEENNAAQYYPDYAYDHPLFTDRMHIYSDSRISDFLREITIDQSVAFLNKWNERRDHREKVYVSYDSTNKNVQAGDISFAEFGHPKDDKGAPVINYAIAYDRSNREPLFYEDYPGSINDVSQFRSMVDKARAFGYQKIGFILDRGYFSEANIHAMDHAGYDFIIMVRGMKDFVSRLILENRGKFEEKRSAAIPEYGMNGMTVKAFLFPSDEKERSFHLYYSSWKYASERSQFEKKLSRMRKALDKQKNRRCIFPGEFHRYFDLIYSPKKGEEDLFLMYREKEDAIERDISLCGYYAIITSQHMSAREALLLYKSRDASEKLFRGDKPYLDNTFFRDQTDEADDAIEAKIFIEFVALIIRNRIYCGLQDEMERIGQRRNYMTVNAALKELEKVELIRFMEKPYQMDHSLTRTQKEILNAFGIDSAYVRKAAAKISSVLAAENGKE